MQSECDRARVTVASLLGESAIEKPPSADEIESAFLHMKRCALCRTVFGPEERARFVSAAILERE